MSVQAKDSIPGVKYRPTRVGSFDLCGRAWLTRSKPGWERRAIARLERGQRRLSGREVYTLAAIQSGAVLMRKHWRAPGLKTTQRKWMAVPPNYTLRELKA